MNNQKIITCPLCHKIILENITLEEYQKKYPNEKFMWCAYCSNTFPININIVEKEVKDKDDKSK